MKTKIVYNEYSQTIRLMPENYWLASVKDGKLKFDSWDGMTNKILKNNLLLKLKIIVLFLKIKTKK